MMKQRKRKKKKQNKEKKREMKQWMTENLINLSTEKAKSGLRLKGQILST